MRKVIFIIFVFFSISANGQTWQINDIEAFNEFDKLSPKFYLENDSLHVINFWATWCKPCVAELPYFEALLEKHKDDNLKITLVSLDFKHQIESKLLAFLNEHNIKSNVVVLTDGRSNDYINKVDPSWEGSIPATLFIKGDKKKFFEKSFHSTEELETIIQSIND